MKGKIAAAAVIGGLAITGTAVAAGGGPVGGLFGEEGQQDLAENLAAELDGVNPNEVSQALESVAEDRRAEHRAQMAEGIAAQLDGVGASAVEDALAKHEEQVRESIEAGERPDMSGLVATVAEELGKGEKEIATALEAARPGGPPHGPGGFGPGGPGFGPEGGPPADGRGSNEGTATGVGELPQASA